MLFWPVLGRGHLEKFRARVKNGKPRNFPALGVPKSKKKVTTLSGMVVRYFLQFAFCPTGNREILVFSGPFGLWHLEKSWARAENGKMQFPGADTLSGMVVRNFFRLCVLNDRTPKIALKEIPGRKQKNAISRSQGHFWLLGKKYVRPKRFS